MKKERIENQSRNLNDYVYLTIWRCNPSIRWRDEEVVKEGFVDKNLVDEIVEEYKNDLMECFDGYEILPVEEVIMLDVVKENEGHKKGILNWFM